MITLSDLMIDVPVQPSTGQEKPHIDPNREYFCVTNCEFLIYSKQKKCWYCLITKLVIPGNISDIIDAKGDMHLYVKHKAVTIGKWGKADSIDDILDLYNSGEYLECLASVS